MEGLEVGMKYCCWVALLAGCGVDPSLGLGTEIDEQGSGRWLTRLAPEVRDTCPSMRDDRGTWNGRPVKGPAGPSPEFCVYERDRADGWYGDSERLDESPLAKAFLYVVEDVRPRDVEASP